MKIVFSRKGFDSGSGGCPSPILDNIPVSLPIPGGTGEPYRYHDLHAPCGTDLGQIVKVLTKGRLQGSHPAHADPALTPDWGLCSLGQDGAAQSHLENQGVGIGDVFVFFGLFQDKSAPKGHPDRKPHHRIFGMMEIERIEKPGPSPAPGTWRELGLPAPHPHTERRDMSPANTIWIGKGKSASRASSQLRLTKPGLPPSSWDVPEWLIRRGLSYHANPSRWGNSSLQLVARGQEFVSEAGEDTDALEWIRKIKKLL